MNTHTPEIRDAAAGELVASVTAFVCGLVQLCGGYCVYGPPEWLEWYSHLRRAQRDLWDPDICWSQSWATPIQRGLAVLWARRMF